MGRAYVAGSRATTSRTGVVATAKHLVGHGLAEGGLNQAPAHIGPRELRDEQLLPFEAAVRRGRHRERHAGLLRGRRRALPRVARAADDDPARRVGLRRDRRVRLHRASSMLVDAAPADQPTSATAAALALEAGVDVELPRTVGLRRAAARRRSRTAASTRPSSIAAVARVLRLKFRARPVRAAVRRRAADGRASRRSAATRRAGARELARALARAASRTTASCPLRAGLRRGSRSSARSPTAPATCSATTATCVHIETLREMRAQRRTRSASPLDDEVVDRSTSWPAGGRSWTRSRARLAATEVDPRARDAASATGRDAEIAEAVERGARTPTSRSSCSASGPGLTDDATTGEFRDRRDLGFIGRQQELLEAVVATGHAGRARGRQRPAAGDRVGRRALRRDPPRLGARAMRARTRSPTCCAGDVEPRRQAADVVPAPRRPGAAHVPPPPDRAAARNWKGDYVDGPAAPLWPFGFGRSYTTFALARPRARSDRSRPTAARSGQRRVDEHRRRGRATRSSSSTSGTRRRPSRRPVLELRGFRRVGARAGRAPPVTFRLSAEQFAYIGADLPARRRAGSDRPVGRDLVRGPAARARKSMLVGFDRPPRRTTAIPDPDPLPTCPDRRRGSLGRVSRAGIGPALPLRVRRAGEAPGPRIARRRSARAGCR